MVRWLFLLRGSSSRETERSKNTGVENTTAWWSVSSHQYKSFILPVRKLCSREFHFRQVRQPVRYWQCETHSLTVCSSSLEYPQFSPVLLFPELVLTQAECSSCCWGRPESPAWLHWLCSRTSGLPAFSRRSASSLFCGYSLEMTGSFDYPGFPHLGGKSLLVSKELPHQKSKFLLMANLEVLVFNELR